MKRSLVCSCLLTALMVIGSCSVGRTVDPYLWGDSNGRIAEVYPDSKTVKIEIAINKNQKFVWLKVSSATIVAKEMVVSAKQLRLGDKVLWFSHTSYGVATGTEMRFVPRKFGKAPPNAYYPKGAKYPISFGLFMDRRRPAVVNSLRPLVLKPFELTSETRSLTFPFDDSDLGRQKYSDVGILTKPLPWDESDSSGKTKTTPAFTFLKTEGAIFCLYEVIQIADLKAGQRIRYIASKQAKGQADRISVTNFPR